MTQLVCNYAPIRFLPYRDIGEFVTVGIALHCPSVDAFCYRLVPQKKTGRVANYFPELDLRIFKAALVGLKRELDRVAGTFGGGMHSQLSVELAQIQMRKFQDLVRRREGLLHFGVPGTRLSDDSPRAALDDLYEHYVNRQFAHKREYQEIIMRGKLSKFLADWNLAEHYHSDQVGDDEFHINIPFVHKSDEEVLSIIKPLDLDRKEPTDVYQHGGTWVHNMERLHKRRRLPAKTIFTIRLPQNDKPRKAAATICDEFRALGIEPISFDDLPEIRRSATEAVRSKDPWSGRSR